MTDTAFLDTLATREHRLDNGLTVLVREDRSAPVVAVVTYVKAGYFDEPDELAGISHVLEHMYFKGTERRGPGELTRETKDAGGYVNAGTIYDHTSYYTVLPSSSLERAMDIQADALQNSVIDADELRRELLVIIQEARRKLDNPGAVASETLFETMFDAHRIRRWRIGTEAVLSGFTRDHVIGFYRNWYRASNTVVVVAGDVDADRVIELAVQKYSAMDAGEPPRDGGPVEPDDTLGFRYREIDGDIVQSYLEWGWRTPDRMHEDTPALNVLGVALGSGRASRLYRHVRDAGHVAMVSASNYTPGDIGVFGISAQLDPSDTHAALRDIAAVVQDVRANGFTDDEIERARNIIEARMLRRLETSEAQANLLADWQALGDWRLVRRYLDAALAVTPAQLRDVAQRYLDPERLTILLYRPRAAPVIAVDGRAVYDSLFGAPISVPGTAAAPSPVAAPTSASRRVRTTPRIEDGVHIFDDHGVRIVIKPRTTTPLVAMALCCRGGMLSEDATIAGMTGLMVRTSVKGTRTRTGAQFADATESLGGSISAGASTDTMDWSLSIPSRHLDRGIELLLDAALEPTFPIEDAERERRIALSDLEELRDNTQQYALRLALSWAFGSHPYGFSVSEFEQSLRSADLGMLEEWHARRVLGGAPVVFVVGDVAQPDRTAAMIADRLRSRTLDAADFDTTAPAWPGTAIQHVEERDKAQTMLAFAFPGPPRNHPDVHALQLLSNALGGGGGRLFEELRSRRSLAYAVSAAPVARWLAGAFIAFIGTAPEREQEARDEMLRELLRTTTEPLDADELERARRYTIGTWQIRQQTHGRQLADLAGALLLGEGLAELREHVPRLAAVTAEDVRAAAERWLRPDQLVEAVVRGTGGSR